MAENGEHHWWYRSTRALLKQLIEPHLPTSNDALYLDAAGGTGATGGWLTTATPTVLADYEPFALEAARKTHPGYLPARTDINHLPFADDSFDVVLCVTALCHRMNPDPAAIVAEFCRVGKPGALICLMEPGGGDWLWRSHDDVTQTARRFSVSSLRGLAEDAGLDVVKATAAFSFLVPPAYAMHIFERGKAKSDVGRNQSGLGGALSLAARAERRMLRRFNVPVGLSSIVVARSPR
jgi:SAM-dependent methyltransferase